MARERTELLDTAATVLAKDFGASMQSIAAAAGIGRTTLHRAFASRDELVEAVTARVLEECAEQFDAARIDDAPVLEAFDRLLDAVIPLARAYVLLFSEPHVYRVERLVADITAQDNRLERYFARGQADGAFRLDVPPRWFVYSVGSQFAAAWWAVQDGFVGAQDARRVLRATILGGLLAQDAR